MVRVSADRRSEAWIDLFEAAKRGESGAVAGEGGADAVFAQLESLIVEQHAQGGITAQAKQAIDRALDAVAVRRDDGADR